MTKVFIGEKEDCPYIGLVQRAAATKDHIPFYVMFRFTLPPTSFILNVQHLSLVL
jgi:hypothetical protein